VRKEIGCGSINWQVFQIEGESQCCLAKVIQGLDWKMNVVYADDLILFDREREIFFLIMSRGKIIATLRRTMKLSIVFEKRHND
jgi:hypothetical protein